MRRAELNETCRSRLVDHTHPTAAQSLCDLVVGDLIADHVSWLLFSPSVFARLVHSLFYFSARVRKVYPQ